MPSLIKLLIKNVIKMLANSLRLNEWKESRPRKFLGGEFKNSELHNFNGNAKNETKQFEMKSKLKYLTLKTFLLRKQGHQGPVV